MLANEGGGGAFIQLMQSCPWVILYIFIAYIIYICIYFNMLKFIVAMGGHTVGLSISSYI
jgi:hypothetical protein